MGARLDRRSISTLLLFLAAFSGVSASAGAQVSHPPEATVSFVSQNASASQMITAITQQTCVPIGIVPGLHPGALGSERRAFNMEKMPVQQALEEVVADIGYRVERKNGVYLLIAYDATAQQLELLAHRLERFGGQKEELPLLQANLANRMGNAVDPVGGYAGSILSSADDERLSLPVMHDASVEEIANRIVTLGSKGMWKANIPAEERLHFGNVAIEFTSYQRYACAHSEKP